MVVTYSGRYLLLRLAINAVALYIIARIVPGIHAGPVSAVVGALVLGFVNAVVRPVLIVLTLPVTVVTLGLFLLVINAATFGLAAFLVPGFTVDGFGPALMGSVLYSLVGIVTGHYLRPSSATVTPPADGPGPGFTLGRSAGFGLRGVGRPDVIEGEAYEPRERE